MQSSTLLAIALVTAAAAANAASADLIVNGDFESGNTGFTSDYINDSSPGAGLTAGAEQGAGYYGIVTNSNTWHPYFASFGDHTTGSGNMMIVNGTDQSNKTVWQQGGVAVVQGATYRLQFWARSAYADSPATLHITASVNSLDTVFQLPGNTGAWQQFSMDFVADSNPETIRLVDSNLALSGNDFAIDDISLCRVTTVPLPPASLAGLSALAGLGGANVLRRRRLRRDGR